MKTCLLGGLLLCAAIAEGATVYVAKHGHDDTGDGSFENPFLTIQKGVDEAGSGDVVNVGEGDFSDVGRVMTLEGLEVPTVVVISKKITLQGAGRGKTYITGAYGDGTGGFADTGVGARRCVYCLKEGANSDIRDVTLRNGATVRANTSVNNDVDLGGGVVCKEGYSLYLYDSEIVDCRAGEGAAISRDVRACRCRFAGNKAKGDSQVCYRNSYTLNCLFENNGRSSSGSSIFTYVQDYTVVNCTFVSNAVSFVFSVNDSKVCRAFNCLVCDQAVRPLSGDDAKYELRHVVQTAAGGSIERYSAQGCVSGVLKELQYFSPAAGIWDSVEGNSIVGKGDIAYMTEAVTGFPASEITTDYNGKPRSCEGRVSVGCFEPQSVRKAPVANFYLAGGAKVVEGETVADSAVGGRWGAVSGTGQVRVGFTGTGELFGYVVSNVGGVSGGGSYTTSRFPDNNSDNGFWLTPTAGGVMTIAAIPATEVIWVDDDADENLQTGAMESPFRTIAAALEAVEPRGLIKVKPGQYAEGAAGVSGNRYRINLSKDVAIRSTDGAGKTILNGGDDIAAIVFSGDNSRYGHVQGFTLTGGAADPSRDPSQPVTGAALICGLVDESARGVSEGVHVTDSVISNNVAVRVCIGGWLERCLLVDNFTTVENMKKGTDGARGSQTYGSILSGCVSCYSASYHAEGGYPTVNTCAHQNSTELNCTFCVPLKDADNRIFRTVNLPNGSTVCINNAMVNPYLDTYTASEKLYAGGNVASPGSSQVCVKSVPKDGFFVNAGEYDFYPRCDSLALGYGEVTTNRYVRYETGDFNGKALAYDANEGKPIPGAFQVPKRLLTVSQDPGRGEVSPSGGIYLADGQSVTVTATAASRPVVGWIVDGKLVDMDDRSYAYSASYEKDSFSLSPVFSPDLYVNASAADDNGDGFTPATAKRKLSSVAEFAVSGDVIHAAAGDYNEGEMSQASAIIAGDKCSPSRIVLKSGVKLIGDAGADLTFITGNPSKGVAGVRCVAAHAGAFVSGFTLRNGATSAETGGEYDFNMGGCVLAPKAVDVALTAVFRDCVISNGLARTGGAVAGGMLHRCRIYGGTGSAGASIAQYSSLDNSFATGNSDSGIRNHYGIRSSIVINTGTGTKYYDMSAEGDAVCENSIIALKNSDASITDAPRHKHMRNCIWNVGGGVVGIDEATCCNVITCNVNMATRATALASLLLDENGMPTAGAPSIDRGDNVLLSGVLDVGADMSGAQRIYNAKVDIGAFEYDCLKEFSSAICGRRMSISFASPMVELKDAAVVIPDGESIGVSWNVKAREETATLSVSALDEGSEMKVEGDGISLSIDEVGKYKVTAMRPTGDFRLIAHRGSAAVSAIRIDSDGLVFIIR